MYSLRGAKNTEETIQFIFDENEKDTCFINGPEEDIHRHMPQCLLTSES